jgi:polyketide cyclase/dehydrase/lipid transport protein
MDIADRSAQAAPAQAASADQGSGTLFEVAAQVRVARTPAEVYALVSDLGRSGEWSEECRGGEWAEGEPGAVGSVFRGVNHREPDVVAWAPVVRGGWTTESEVVAAEPGRTFRWAMRDGSGRKQQSVWGFDIEPAGDGSVLTHHFWMGAATEGIRGIIADMDAQARERFFADWAAKLKNDLAATVARIKNVAEQA